MKHERITPEMIVLDVVAAHRATEAVFQRFDRQAGECICCNALFETLEHVAEKYALDLKRLLEELERAAAPDP